MNVKTIKAFKYFLRINKIPLSKFGTGTKNSPIKLKKI